MSAGLPTFPKFGGTGTRFGYALSIRDKVSLDAFLTGLRNGTSPSQPAHFAVPAGEADPASAAPDLSDSVPQALSAWTEPEPPNTDETAVAAVERDPLSRDEPPAIKRALVIARLGQGGYRRQLIDLWEGRCAVTGCAMPAVLIASHAVAWAECRTNAERLDKHNGLLLASSVDRLFDGGLIAFSDDGRLLRKPEVSDGDPRSIGVMPDARLRAMPEGVRSYLARHRERHGF